MRHLITVLLLGPLVAAEVGELGRPGNWDFPGATSFPAALLRRALSQDGPVRDAAHPRSELDDLLRVVRERLGEGYRHQGFAAVRVEAGVQAGRLVLAVQEGPRLRRGQLRVEGATAPLAQAIQTHLTRSGVTEHADPWDVDSTVRSESGSIPWPEDGWASCAARTEEDLTRQARRAADEAGHPDARLSVRVQQEGDRAVAVVTVADPGPAGVLDEVVVEGLERTDRAALLAWLGVAPGQGVSQTRMDVLRHRLRESGRFAAIQMELQPLAVPGRRRLRLALQELDATTPLPAPPSPAEAAS